MKKLNIILVLSFLISINCLAPPSHIKFNLRSHYISILKQSELTLENVKKYIQLVDIKYPEIVIRQYILETGWGKSNICKTYNNLFGFRGANGYFKYKHWTESIESYKRFQDRKYKEGCYYTFLEKVGYSESNKYVKTLKLIKI